MVAQVFVPVVAGCLVVAAASLIHARRLSRRARTAATDRLTGLPAYEGLMRALAADAGHRAALLWLDLDRFEAVNEALGRPAGDRVLATVGGLLDATVGYGICARTGGDEFAVLLPGAWTEEARAVAERIRRGIGDLRAGDGECALDLGASIGIAPIDGAVTPEEAVRRANAACRTAKAHGRNRVDVYRPALSEEAVAAADARWSVRLKDALREGRMALAFQPIIGLTDGRVAHYEALARITAEDGAAVEATEFIPTAERCGLIREIDRWVIRAALDRVAAERARGNRVRCGINLSGHSLYEEETLAFIEREIAARRIDPSWITLEITETAAIANLAQARRAIDRLRALGCRFALDDFGTGLSSLAYLRYLPVDFLKIDGAFVRDLANDSMNQALVRAVTELAHALGIATIAECVEDAGSLEALERIGVDFAQGFWLGRPSSLVRPTIVLPEAAPVAECQSDEIVLPPRTPYELAEFLRFIDSLDAQTRALRDGGDLPAAAVTRPDEFDGIVFDVVGTMRAQVDDALRGGAEKVSLRLPVSPELAALVRWSEPRMEVLAGITRAGLVKGEWAGALEVMLEIFHAVSEHLAHRQPA